MKFVLISIIVPVYKVALYLRECLDSIAASSLDCWEAILIDDGSPDNCPQICDEYAEKDNRFRVIHQENAGVAAARNAGLDVAQGEWVWFVDSDDVVDLKEIPNVVAQLENKKHIDLVLFDLQAFQDGNLPSYSSNENAIYLLDSLLKKDDFLIKNNYYHHQRLWYKHKLINDYNLRFSEGVKTGEDGEFMYKYMMVCNNPTKVDYTIYYYRIRPGSATTNANTYNQHIKDKMVIFYHLLSFMKEHQIQQEPWIVVRLQESMRNLLYAVFKTKQCHSKRIQNEVRNIMTSYSQSGYKVFNTIPYKIAFSSLVLYCFLLRSYFLIKGLK